MNNTPTGYIRALALSAVLTFAAASAKASVITYAGPVPGSFDIQAELRGLVSGSTLSEARLRTPLDPSASFAPANLNPLGAPAWSYGSPHLFSFGYVAATGTATLWVDFDLNSLVDAGETSVQVSPTLVGFGFDTLRIRMVGDPNQTVQLSDLNIDGNTSFGPYLTSGTTILSAMFNETGGGFYNLAVGGKVTFSGSGASTTNDQLFIQLANQVRMPDQDVRVPEPKYFGAALLGLGMVGAGFVRRRRPGNGRDGTPAAD